MALTTAEAADMMTDSSRLPGACSDQSGASVAPNPWSALDRLVVIDSTWNGTNTILKVDSLVPSVSKITLRRLLIVSYLSKKWIFVFYFTQDERVKDLPCVKLGEAETHFWR